MSQVKGYGKIPHPWYPIKHNKEPYIMGYDYEKPEERKISFNPVHGLKTKDGYHVYTCHCKVCDKAMLLDTVELYKHIHEHYHFVYDEELNFIDEGIAEKYIERINEE